MADGLSLANIAFSKHKSASGETLIEGGLVNVVTQQPFMEFNKTIVLSSNTNSSLVTPPKDYTSALDNVDANDTITYRIHLENSGHATAYDINVTDRFLQDGTFGQGLHGCQITTIDKNSTVDGSGDLFLDHYSIPQMEAGTYYDLTYTCVVDQDANPVEDINNIAALISYSSTPQPGSPNYVIGFIESKTKLILTSKMEIVKNIVDSSIPDTNPNDQINQGEIVNFEINVTLGEGTYTNYTLTDNTCTNLTLVSYSNITDVPPLDGSAGTVSVTGTSGSVDGTLTYSCEKQMITSGINTARVTAYLMSPKEAHASWTVTAPHVVTVKDMSPPRADAGDTVTVTMDWTNDTSHPAYNCSVIDPLNASIFDISTVSMTTTPAGYTCNVVGNEVQCDYTGDLTLPCPDGPAEFTVNVRDDVNTSGNLVNELSFTGVTLPDGHPGENNTTINGSVESNATDTLRLRSPSRPVKIFTATSEDFTDSGDLNLNTTPHVAVGEVIDVKISYGFYEGTTLNVDLQDLLTDRVFSYVPGTMTIGRSNANLNVEHNDINSALNGVTVVPFRSTVGPLLNNISSGIWSEILQSNPLVEKLLLLPSSLQTLIVYVNWVPACTEL